MVADSERHIKREMAERVAAPRRGGRGRASNSDSPPNHASARAAQRAMVVGIMPQDPASDPIMRRLRAALDARYGERLERAVLFGSRARGDARPDSDYDVAVFLRDYGGLWTELQPLGEITTEILLDTDAVVSPKPFPEGAYRARTLLMREIRRDGVDL